MSLRLGNRFTHRAKGTAFGAGFFLALPFLAHSGKPPFLALHIIQGQTASGYAYQNGGFTSDEQNLMLRAAHNFNLRMRFINSAGTLTVPNFVLIGSNQRGVVEKIMPSAPWLYIQLPPGPYSVLARFRGGIVLIRDIHLEKGQSRMLQVRAGE